MIKRHPAVWSSIFQKAMHTSYAFEEVMHVRGLRVDDNVVNLLAFDLFEDGAICVRIGLANMNL